MPSDAAKLEDILSECEDLIAEEYERCRSNAPNFGVTPECFRDSLVRSVHKFLAPAQSDLPSADEVRAFIESIKKEDLFLALACANANERAWWEFDHRHRGYLERVARHLASSDINAQEVVDLVYVELYGTKVVEGRRVSKFASYSGKGSLRGWLRTIIWHSLVDLHRAGHGEVSLDEMTENVGEGHAHASFAVQDLGGESRMMDTVKRERYRKSTVEAMESAFGSLDDHEKLILLYYHRENLKLREIARLVESPSSPLRKWFQRRSVARELDPGKKIHESTVMRWLKKTYKKVLKAFCAELRSTAGFGEEEIDICLELATRDLAGRDIYSNLASNAP